MQWAQKQKGFTIVDLLIVVVVIAILAAVAIVAYNGIIQRTHASSAQTAANQAAKALYAYAVDHNDSFPADLATVGINNSDTTAFSYSRNVSPASPGFCVSAVANSTAIYHVAKNFSYGPGPTILDQNNPAEGYCPTHGSTPTIINYSINPSFESNVTTGTNVAGGGVRASSTTRAQSGATSMQVTMASGYTAGNTGAAIFTVPSYLANGMQANTTYTVTTYVYVPTGSASVQLTVLGSGRTGVTNPPGRSTTLKNQWVRLQNTFTTTASDGSVTAFVMNNETTTGTGDYWVDATMITQGTDVVTYADGTTSGWVWNGTTHLSSSTGPQQ